jgi:glycosyltransferase involved in cell wall biosynthesis
MAKKKLLSVIVPVANKEKTIKEDLKKIEKALKPIRYDHEIICVIDGQTDNSLAEAKKFKSDKIQVVGYETNKGKGFAVRYGMVRSKGDIVAFIDAGMEIDPNNISLLLEHMHWYDSDVIVGSIRHSASKAKGYPLKRKILSWGYHRLTRFLFGLKITDCQRGIKLFKREVLEKVLPRLLIKRWAFDIEMLAVAKRLGFKNIHDGPVKMDASRLNYSNIRTTTIWGMLLDTMAVFYRLKILRYYDDARKHQWRYDPELEFRIKTG